MILFMISVKWERKNKIQLEKGKSVNFVSLLRACVQLQIFTNVYVFNM